MKIVHSWLQRYLKFRLAPEELAERLGMLGLEVASIERPGATYANFVVGSVLSTERHPNADRLTVCRVDAGTETLQIVCGAPNVAAGQKVALGLVGARVPRNQHDPEGQPFELARVAIRGVESFGMICSEYELGLGREADGILVLDPAARPGQPLAEYLGIDDVVYDIEITPNRPDWLSHFGVAREIGVLVGREPRFPAVRVKEGKELLRRHLTIRVEDRKNCVRFAARMVRGVRVGASPAWLQQSLRAAGLRPRNAVVDVTNFVMLECGHPLHAFDHRLLRGSTLVIRQAGAEKSFRTLDGVDHQLPADTVMVCDAEREVSIAGVMGGENSEISEQTVDVVIESACWDPVSIRRTAKRLGISSDASQRFERGADPERVRYALDRAAQLVQELAGGTVLKGVIDVTPRKVTQKKVSLRTQRANQLLGTSLKEVEVKKLLRPLGVTPIGRKGPAVLYAIPTFRVDLEREVDLIEEVARVHGYDKIEAKTTAMVDLAQAFPDRDQAESVRERVIGLGYRECLTDSMQDEYRVSLGTNAAVRVLNPLGVEMGMMRSSLVPGLLDTVARNQNFGNVDLRLFEIGHVFSKGPGRKPPLVEDFVEEQRICLVATGLARPRYHDEPPRQVDIFDVKGDILAFLDQGLLDKCRWISYSTSNGLTDDTVAIEISGTYAGFVGRVKSEVATRFGIERDVFVAECLMEFFTQRSPRVYQPLPRFPKVKRDLAFLVDHTAAVGEIEEAIRTACGEKLVALELFDVYAGENVPQGKRSLAFSLEILSRERTLTDADIEALLKRVVTHLEKEHGAVLRAL
jgi:phenylalanyl-tRNA synthetase beta chain